jgi:hypothetical protein
MHILWSWCQRHQHLWTCPRHQPVWTRYAKTLLDYGRTTPWFICTWQALSFACIQLLKETYHAKMLLPKPSASSQAYDPRFSVPGRPPFPDLLEESAALQELLLCHDRCEHACWSGVACVRVHVTDLETTAT